MLSSQCLLQAVLEKITIILQYSKYKLTVFYSDCITEVRCRDVSALRNAPQTLKSIANGIFVFVVVIIIMFSLWTGICYFRAITGKTESGNRDLQEKLGKYLILMTKVVSWFR